MKFQLSNCIAFQTENLAKAKDFYESVFGLQSKSSKNDEVEFSTSPIRLFLGDSSKAPGLVMEFLVEDLELARQHLERHGCKTLEWQGKGNPCYMRDPFGLTFNLFEK